MVAHRTLTPFVRVRILHPLPKTGCPLDNRFFTFIFQTVKELSSQKLRREEKCERKPSGFPFASNNPPQRQNCEIMLQNSILQFWKQLVKGVQRGRGKLAAPGRITGCPQRIRNSFAHRPGGIPAGTFSIYRTAYYWKLRDIFCKILTKKLRGDMLDLPRKEGSPRNELFCRHRK